MGQIADIGSAGRPAFGQDLGRHFHLPESPAVVTRSATAVKMAATRLIGADVTTTPIPRDDAYIVAIQLQDVTEHGLWLGDRAIAAEALMAGSFSVVHLDAEPRAVLPQPFDCIDFFVPRHGLATLADEAGLRPFGELSCRAGTSYDDPVVRHLTLSLKPALARPCEADQLFIDHVMTALHLRLVGSYGGVDLSTLQRPLGLARWQVRRATDRLSQSDAARLPLAELAAECGLSRSHFGRAFKSAMGLTPHQWMAQNRLQRAQAALLDTRHTLGEIAQICGYADQSHFTRAFRAAFGQTPGAWRRLRLQ